MAAPDFQEIELALTSTAMAGDAGGLYRIASNLMDEGVAFDTLLFDYLMETERSVGHRWAQGDYLVPEEHAVTAAIETVISLLTGMLDQPDDGPLVVIATAEGDEHSLPARAVSANLLFQGYRTIFLGADLPGEQLSEFLEAEEPVALVLSVAMSTHLLGARSVVEAAHAAGVPVLVGGKAFGPNGTWSAAVGADRWVASLREVEGVVEGWAESPPELKDVPAISEDLAALRENRSIVAALADKALGAESAGRLGMEVRLLIAAVEGSMLTGDDHLVEQMLDWQRTSLTAHGHDPEKVVEALEGPLADHSPAGSEVLTRVAARA